MWRVPGHGSARVVNLVLERANMTPPNPGFKDQAAKPNAGWMSKRYLSATWFKTRRAARNR